MGCDQQASRRARAPSVKPGCGGRSSTIVVVIGNVQGRTRASRRPNRALGKRSRCIVFVPMSSGAGDKVNGNVALRMISFNGRRCHHLTAPYIVSFGPMSYSADNRTER